MLGRSAGQASEGVLRLGSHIAFRNEKIGGYISIPNDPAHRTSLETRPLVMERTSVGTPTRLMDVAFEVVGATEFVRRRQLADSDGELGDQGGRPGAQTPTQRAQLTRRVALALEEQALNRAQYTRQLGTEVQYGEGYQLRHVESGDWLCCESLNVAGQVEAHVWGHTGAPQGSATLRVMLVHERELSKHCIFKFMPAYRSKHIGSPVKLNDCVVLEAFTGLVVQSSANVRPSLFSAGTPISHCTTFSIEEAMLEAAAGEEIENTSMRVVPVSTAKSRSNSTAASGHVAHGGDVVVLSHNLLKRRIAVARTHRAVDVSGAGPGGAKGHSDTGIHTHHFTHFIKENKKDIGPHEMWEIVACDIENSSEALQLGTPIMLRCAGSKGTYYLAAVRQEAKAASPSAAAKESPSKAGKKGRWKRGGGGEQRSALLDTDGSEDEEDGGSEWAVVVKFAPDETCHWCLRTLGGGEGEGEGSGGTFVKMDPMLLFIEHMQARQASFSLLRPDNPTTTIARALCRKCNAIASRLSLSLSLPVPCALLELALCQNRSSAHAGCFGQPASAVRGAFALACDTMPSKAPCGAAGSVPFVPAAANTMIVLCHDTVPHGIAEPRAAVRLALAGAQHPARPSRRLRRREPGRGQGRRGDRAHRRGLRH